MLAAQHAPHLGFGRFIISAPSPFSPDDLNALRHDSATVVWQLFPEAQSLYADMQWSMFDEIDRVYVSQLAVSRLNWKPRWNFIEALRLVRDGNDFRSPLARAVGSKGFHTVRFSDGPYPVDVQRQ
ncbi:hypothetical protein V1282_001389 [Nitrobacteraceae bacterium AZCC 2146]